MSRVRVRFTVLCEDEQAKEFVRVALGERGAGRREIRVLPLPSKPSGGAGDQHVRTRYVGQVRALRDEGRGSLIVHIDADPKNTVAARHEQLAKLLTAAGEKVRQPQERIVELVPKRNIETWIHALDPSLGVPRPLDEKTAYRKLNRAEMCGNAAREFDRLSRLPQPATGPDLLPSLLDGLAELGRLPAP